ncbi:unnamed protein product [Eruca vesicaria subsp. sativa]|uniref:Uncharacterized protein n=1 Tax=Eruca vesicaria subsp. sativa TaxID=29727 RepID=A0ABC8K9C0_ERUVS|nr:unnamed protein product [Eruca vesicaria subsp. sativa]
MSVSRCTKKTYMSFPEEEEHDDDVAKVIEENKVLFYCVSELEELLRSLHCRDADTSSRNGEVVQNANTSSTNAEGYRVNSKLSSLGYEILFFGSPLSLLEDSL